MSEARLKAEEYCVYQDRCHKEVRDKLYSWGLPTDHVDAIMYDLIQKNFLNEERFTASFVSGKFNIKRWGKNKIRQALLLKGISKKMIDEQLETIDETIYFETATSIASKKSENISAKNSWEKQQKIKRYMYGRGYEASVIDLVLQELGLKDESW